MSINSVRSSFGLALLLGIFAVSGAQAQGPLGRILNTMDEYNKNLSSLRADITMVKTDAGLGGISDTTIGDTSYLPKTSKREMYVRINWTKPRQEHIVVIGDKYWLYSPHRNMAYEGKTNKAQNNAKAGGAFAFLGMSKEQRKANYKAAYEGEETLKDGTRTWHLKLTPITASSYKLADIWVNKDGLPQQTKITEKNSDSTTILLSNVDVNKKISGDDFRLAYAKGTKIQRQ